MAVGEAFVEIGVDFAELRRNLNKAKGEFSVKVKQIEGNASRAGKRIGQSMGRGLATGLKAATVGLGALVAGGGLAVKSFITSQKESLRLAKTLKATGNAAGFTAEQLEAHAMKLQDATTADDTDIKKVQALLASFTSITGERFTKATKAVLDMSSAMGTDLSQTALQVGKALGSPAEGLTALSRSGIKFTKEQKAMIKGMVEMGKVTEAQNEIFEILKVNGIDGNADATSALADQWEQAKNILEDMAVSLGNGIAGMFGMSKGSTKLTDSLKSVRGEISKLVESGFFKDMGEVFIPVLKAVAKLTVKIAAGLSMIAAGFAAVAGGKGIDWFLDKIDAIQRATDKTVDAIENMGNTTKKAGAVANTTAKKQVDSNKKLKDGIQRRIDAMKEELAEKRKLLAEDEKTLKNMQAVRDAVQDIASISTIGIEDMFSTRNVASVEKAKKDLQGVIDDNIQAKKGTIKAAKQDIKTLESKLRAEDIEKAAAQQVKNQEIQIQLQKQTNQLIKQQGTGSVFSSK